MKVGNITKPNQKGQIVIPKELRDVLGLHIDAPLNVVLRGKGIYLYPIDEVISLEERESSYLKLLERTKGKWSENWTQLRKKRKKIEEAASKARKQQW